LGGKTKSVSLLNVKYLFKNFFRTPEKLKIGVRVDLKMTPTNQKVLKPNLRKKEAKKADPKNKTV
jgi:hypothetical protein